MDDVTETERLRKALMVCEFVLHRQDPSDAETHAGQQASGAYRTDWEPDDAQDDGVLIT